MKIAGAVVAAVVLMSGMNARADAPSKTISLPSRNGPVAFNHSTHKALTCTQCHKSDKGGPIEGFGKTMDKVKAHASCHECHKKEGKGPQKCTDCHKKGS